jgi:hypothetical protein
VHQLDTQEPLVEDLGAITGTGRTEVFTHHTCATVTIKYIYRLFMKVRNTTVSMGAFLCQLITAAFSRDGGPRSSKLTLVAKLSMYLCLDAVIQT